MRGGNAPKYTLLTVLFTISFFVSGRTLTRLGEFWKNQLKKKPHLQSTAF